ncbi:monovalent cation/H+ antiporter complex subunit F [Xanthobacter sp. V4C-4]|uniref:monovalent cation/H+ antiporter complex subunit F n=1 Tax=Xanthobacter cornucopiae TaxID=3119924 RepID=UPI00372B5945
MADFLVASAALLVLITATGLAGVWRSGDVGRIMALQLLGTGGIAVLLLLSIAQDDSAVLDVALLLALLAACAVAAFRAVALRGRRARGAPGRRPAP